MAATCIGDAACSGCMLTATLEGVAEEDRILLLGEPHPRAIANKHVSTMVAIMRTCPS